VVGSRRRLASLLVGTAMLLVAGCSSSSDEADPGATGAPNEETATGEPAEPSVATEPRDAPQHPELRDELVLMLEEDQAERMGESATINDRARADRLEEIVDEYGWPTFSMVGEDGATAAWAIAQHADHDVELQERMLDLMKVAAADGEADPSQTAFLEDRVALNLGRPQIYGSQIGCVDGEAVPGPIEDEQNVDARRAEVGLDPLDDYLAQFAEVCGGEQ
jgi:hypothetical protein